MRKLSSSLMVALAVVAMLWGNCLSCPQMLAADQSAHGCCHKHQPTSPQCQTQGIHFVDKADTHAPVIPVVAVLAVVPAHVVASERSLAPRLIPQAPLGSFDLLLTLRV